MDAGRMLRARLLIGILVVLATRSSCPAAEQSEAKKTETKQQATASAEVTLKNEKGALVTRGAIVTLLAADGEIYREEVSSQGKARLENVEPGEYALRILAPGYLIKSDKVAVKSPEKIKLEYSLQADSSDADSAARRDQTALNPKAQAEVGKVIEAFRAKKYGGALDALVEAAELAPQSGEVQFLFGMYHEVHGRSAGARINWARALELEPHHYRALVALSELLLRENKAEEAAPLIARAIEEMPRSWLPRALSAEAHLRMGQAKEALEQGQIAKALGYQQASNVDLVMAAAHAKQGEREAAAKSLHEYLQKNPADEQAKKQMAALESPAGQDVAIELRSVAPEPIELLQASWMPPDVDETAGVTEVGAGCDIEKVLARMGERVQEFVRNVDRFTATELIEYQPVNKWGMAGIPISRKFDYVVDIKETTPGLFSVEEFRNQSHKASEYLDGVATHGCRP